MIRDGGREPLEMEWIRNESPFMIRENEPSFWLEILRNDLSWQQERESPKVFNGAYNTAIASPVVSYNGLYTNGLYNTYGAGVHAIGKREAEADSQWVYNNGYTPLTGYTGYNGLAGYTTPYTYGNVWNRAQYLW